MLIETVAQGQLQKNWKRRLLFRYHASTRNRRGGPSSQQVKSTASGWALHRDAKTYEANDRTPKRTASNNPPGLPWLPTSPALTTWMHNIQARRPPSITLPVCLPPKTQRATITNRRGAGSARNAKGP